MSLGGDELGETLSTEILLGIIALVSATIGPAIGWVIARQSANDRRANVARDLETVKQLDPKSEVAKVLSGHIDQTIRSIVERDLTRESVNRSVWTFLPAVGVSGAMIAIQTWRGDSSDRALDDIVDGVYWGLFVCFVVTGAVAALSVLRTLWLFVQVAFKWFQVQYLKVVLWRKGRQYRKLQKRASALTGYTDELLEAITAPEVEKLIRQGVGDAEFENLISEGSRLRDEARRISPGPLEADPEPGDGA